MIEASRVDLISVIEAYHAHAYIDCACADDLLPYVPFTIIYTATGDVVHESCLWKY